MRRKKQKHTRRTVAYYKVNYGLHEPFKVLLDGNFLHATLGSGLGELDKHLPDLLGGRTQTYVTPCILHELRSLGPDFRDTAAVAQKIKLHYCGHGRHGSHSHHKPDQGAGQAGQSGHADDAAAAGGTASVDDAQAGAAAEAGAEGVVPSTALAKAARQGVHLAAGDCIRHQIGASNAQHWWVASQDRQLREALGQVPGMPLLFATVNGIHLETPSEMSKSIAKEAEQASMALPAHERASAALQDLEDIRPKLKTSARFRLNKAKGPNPLAARKKLKKPQPQSTARPVGEGEGATKTKRRRKRKKGDASAEADA